MQFFQKLTLTLALLLTAATSHLSAQTTVPLQDMSFWRPSNAQNWRIAGSVKADPYEDEAMKATPGVGVLVNLPDKKNRANLLSVAEYGDVEVSFDVMMARHSNSGFYLQGRYEVQLLDSWGKQQPNFGDCGGIYARRRFTPQEELFEGYPPLQNACKAPGLWQKMEISFRAPRFNEAGVKIKNARITVRLNGVLVQDDRELTGPTGGPISEQEAARGPFMIQGDHGPVAFKNFSVKEVGNTPPEVGPVTYEVIYGNYRELAEFQDKKPELSGTASLLSWEYARKEDGFVIRSAMKMKAPQAGTYRFTLQTGGNSVLTVAGQTILPKRWTYSTNQRSATLELPAGEIPIEIIYYKMDGWMPPMLAFWIESPDGSKGAYHSLSSTLALTPPDPIYLDAKTPLNFRSFMDYQEQGVFKKRIVHAIQIGHPHQLHYTYNLDNGAPAQIWKGAFLNTSPMWDSRGDGSSTPRGALLAIGNRPSLTTFEAMTDLSDTPPTAAGFRSLGYDIEEGNLPAFRYEIYGATVKDRLRVTDQKYLTRTLQLTGASKAPLFCRLAVANAIEEVKKGLFSVDNGDYYIETAKDVAVQIVEKEGVKILYAPVSQSLVYAILW